MAGIGAGIRVGDRQQVRLRIARQILHAGRDLVARQNGETPPELSFWIVVKFWGLFPYISYQALYCGRPLTISVCVPICSTVPSLKPSKPTHSTQSCHQLLELGDVVTAGTIHDPLTMVTELLFSDWLAKLFSAT